MRGLGVEDPNSGQRGTYSADAPVVCLQDIPTTCLQIGGIFIPTIHSEIVFLSQKVYHPVFLPGGTRERPGTRTALRVPSRVTPYVRVWEKVLPEDSGPRGLVR